MLLIPSTHISARHNSIRSPTPFPTVTLRTVRFLLRSYFYCGTREGRTSIVAHGGVAVGVL